MATIRAICSLTAASRKHLNSRTRKLIGTTSSKMLAAEGRNSYCVSAAGVLSSVPCKSPIGSSVSTTASRWLALSKRVKATSSRSSRPAVKSCKYRSANTSTSAKLGLSSKWVNASSIGIFRKRKAEMPRLPTTSRLTSDATLANSLYRAMACRSTPALYPAHIPRLAERTNNVACFGSGRDSSRGWDTSNPLRARWPTNAVIRRV